MGGRLGCLLLKSLLEVEVVTLLPSQADKRIATALPQPKEQEQDYERVWTASKVETK